MLVNNYLIFKIHYNMLDIPSFFYLNSIEYNIDNLNNMVAEDVYIDTHSCRKVSLHTVIKLNKKPQFYP